MNRPGIYIPSDPLFPIQWHLLNRGNLPDSIAGYDINVISVWPDYTGRGVLVGVLDTGLEETHPDLIQNYRQDLAWDVELNLPGAAVRAPDENHATAVAGLVAASADNGIGGAGVAWGADFTAYRTPIIVIPTEKLLGEFQHAASRMIADGIDVSVNSWGPSLQPFMAAELQEDYQAVMRDMMESGRDGLGIVTLFAGGNDRQKHFDANYDPTDGSPWAIVVAASDQGGGISFYSTPGASVLIAAPGSAPRLMVTTDRLGSEGYNTEPGDEGNYTDRDGTFFSGTSAAAPVAGGVASLMLEANPRLGYRDVQEILVYSAKRATFLDRDHDFAFNGARDWNGGALLASHDFGYGHIDAHAAVRLAESWVKQGTVANLVFESGQVSQSALTVEPGRQISATASFASNYRVEQMVVELTVDIREVHGLVLELISPDGMVSRLLNRPPLVDDGTAGEGGRVLAYKMNTVLNWGSDLAGDWTLRLSNDQDGDTVHLLDWSIQAYTDGPATGARSQVFTDEFGRFSDLQPGRTVLDPSDGAILNAAAVTHDVRFDLASGVSWIGGTQVGLADVGGFRHLVAGDGNDILIGNGADNLLMGGRGNNHIDGGAGQDVARFIGDSTAYALKQGDGVMTVQSLELSGGGIDVLYGIDLLLFSDQVVLARKPGALDADLFDADAYLDQYPDIAAALAAGQLSSARQHYDQWGKSEGRNPNALFNEAWYLLRNPDVAAGVAQGGLESGFQHYMEWGWSEGRNPTAWMDIYGYLDDNPDVAAAQMNPLLHYLSYGIHEGREISALPADMWV